MHLSGPLDAPTHNRGAASGNTVPRLKGGCSTCQPSTLVKEVNSRPATKIAIQSGRPFPGSAPRTSTRDHKTVSACLNRALRPIPARPNALTLFRSTAGNSGGEAFTVSRASQIPFAGGPPDSRSRARSAYLPRRTQTMAIITMCRFVSTFKWTIPWATGRFRQMIGSVVRS